MRVYNLFCARKEAADDVTHTVVSKLHSLLKLIIVTLTLGFGAGCFTTGIDPEKALPGKGYVDFYGGKGHNYAWIIFCEEPLGETRVGSYSISNQIIRIECPPGTNHFKVVLDRDSLISLKPSPYPEEQNSFPVEVDVGMVTPVKINSFLSGKYYYDNIEYIPPGTAERSSRVGNLVTIQRFTWSRGYYVTNTVVALRWVNVNIEKPVPFRVKKEMPYYQKVRFF